MPPATSVSELLARLGDAAVAAGMFAGILLAVYFPGRFLLVPALDRLGDRLPFSETAWNTLVKVTNATIAVFALYLAIPLSGLATTPTTIAAITAAATVAIGFASRDALSNLVSGAFIVVDPKFRIGDWIQWNDREGVVEDISFRVTRVHTFDNELITVPNSQLTGAAVTNPGAKDTLRITQELPIGYDESIDEVEAIVIDVAEGIDGVLERPRASVRILELGDSAVVVAARFWIPDPQRSDVLRIRSAFIERVTSRFAAAGVEMPYPHRELSGTVDVGASPWTGDGDDGPGDGPG